MKQYLVALLLLLLFGATLGVKAQEFTVTGVVIDAVSGEPLPGVNIWLAKTQQGTTTDFKGQYSITVKGVKEAVLTFTYLGMAEERRSVSAAIKILNVRMHDDVKLMQEVVAVAYGKRKKGTLAGSVSAVDGSKIADIPVASIDQALQGKAPGLTVISNSGEPSDVATFSIRGTNSINSGTTPLFIMDGVPISASDFNAIAPGDIESVSVLKDASSTSIYGARAANGVVVITTKRGVEMDKVRVTFRAQAGLSTLAQDKWTLMNTEERIAFEKEIGMDAGQNYAKLMQTDVNWRDIVFTDAWMQSYDFQVSRATDKLNYYVSANVFDQDGITAGSSFKRYTTRTNVDYQAGKKIKLGTNTLITYEEAEQADQGSYTTYSPISAMRFMLPYWDPYDKKGNIIPSNKWAGTGINPMDYMDQNPQLSKKYKVISTMYAEITPFKGFTWRSQWALDYTHGTTFAQSFPTFSPNNGQGSAGRSSYDATQVTITNTATYQLDINDAHHLNLMLGQEGVDSNSENFMVMSRGQNNAWLTNISNGSTASRWSDGTSSHSFLSFFGRGEYNYQGKYYAEASLRSDASSRFGKNGRWATFWALGGMWDISKELFMAPTKKWLTRAQIALSTGTSGNSSIPNYDHLALVGGGAVYNGETGIYPMQAGNEDLRWERLWTTNLALHLGFWNRVNLDVEFYNKRTTDMLMEVPQSYSVNGASARWDNVGVMLNRGVEVTLDATLVRTDDWRVSVEGNFSYNKNKITELYNGLDEYEIAGTQTKLQKGHSVGEFYIVRFAGVNPANGDALWYKKDGTITNEYSEEDKVLIGKNYLAPWEGGFGLNVSWKGLSLSTQWSWVAGRYMLNNDRYFEESNGLFSVYNQSKRMLYDRWKKPGDVTDIPRYGITPQMDSRFLEDASFMRMKNIMLAWRLPAKWMKKTGFIQGVRLYVQGQNLLTFTPFSGLDPENSFNVYKAQYPATRQYTFGGEITF